MDSQLCAGSLVKMVIEHHLVILFIIGFFIPPTCANTTDWSAGLRVWCLVSFLGFYLLLRSSVCYRMPSLQSNYQATSVN